MSDSYGINATIGADDSGFQAAFDRVDKSLSDWGFSFSTLYQTGASFFKGFGVDLDQFAGKLGVAGPTLAAFGGIAVTVGKQLWELGVEFDAVNETIAKGTGATGDALDALNGSFRDLLDLGIEQDLKDVSQAFADLNTKLGLTGDDLRDTTKLMSDFADVTGQSVTEAVGGITNIVNKWGLSMEDVPDLLDQLTVASQNSGMSVRSMEDILKNNGAQLQAFGMSITDSVAMMAAFDKGGVNSTVVMKGLTTALARFSEDGRDAEEALKDVFKQIKDGEDPTRAMAIATETFGAKAGAEMVKALRSGNISIDDFRTAMLNAKGAVSSTSDASDTFQDKMSALGNRIKGAFAPAGEALVSAGKDLLDFADSVLDQIIPIVKPIADIIKVVIDSIMTVFRDLTGAFGEVAEAWGIDSDMASTSAAVLFENVKAVFKGITDVLGDAFRLIAALFKGDWESAWIYAQIVVLKMTRAVLDVASAMVNGLIDIVNALTSKLNVILEKVGISIPQIGHVAFSEMVGINDSIDALTKSLGIKVDKQTKEIGIQIKKTGTATREDAIATKDAEIAAREEAEAATAASRDAEAAKAKETSAEIRDDRITKTKEEERAEAEATKQREAELKARVEEEKKHTEELRKQAEERQAAREEYARKAEDISQARLEREKADAVEGALAQRSSIEDVLAVATEYDNKIYDSFYTRIQKEREAALKEAEDKKYDAETVANINAVFDEQLTEFKRGQAERRITLENDYTSTLLGEQDKRVADARGAFEKEEKARAEAQKKAEEEEKARTEQIAKELAERTALAEQYAKQDLQATIAALEAEERAQLAAATERKASIADIVDIAAYYDELELASYMMVLEKEREAALKEADEKKADKETYAAINKLYDDKISAYHQTQVDARVTMEKNLTTSSEQEASKRAEKEQEELEKRTAYESSWADKAAESELALLNTSIDYAEQRTAATLASIERQMEAELEKAAAIGASEETLANIHKIYQDKMTAVSKDAADKQKAAGLTVKDGWTNAIDQMIEKGKSWNSTMTTVANGITMTLSTGLVKMGTALFNGEDAWGSLANTALMALADILEAIGKQLIALSVVHYVMLDFVGGTLAAVGAAAAFVAAGLVKGWAARYAALGDDYTKAGAYVVGEQGPELVELPQGARVSSASATRDLLSGGSKQITFAPVFQSPKALSPAEQMRELRQQMREAEMMGVFA